ncbi:hypothetical protein GCK32_015686 [Trichostrongylus colubriformis]|uniref:Uncharacterized protein n=1 Tax=Trichostrongylus colubriformis TaxID=6319 RepID=A0AAN8IBD4_TRICO
MTLLTAISLCHKKKSHQWGKFAPYMDSKETDKRSRKMSEEVTAPRVLWNKSSESGSRSSTKPRLQKTPESGLVKMRKQKSKESKRSSQDKSGDKSGESASSDTVAVPAKKTPDDVDLNDFVVRAAAMHTVVDPTLVKKKGNIDDEVSNPANVKARLKQVEDEMNAMNSMAAEEKSKDDERDIKQQQQGIKWGDAKCVVYEIRDQVTLEDDLDDAADVY